MAIYQDAIKEILVHLESNPEKVLPTLQVVKGDGLLKKFSRLQRRTPR